MGQRWQTWAILCLVFAIVAEAINIFAPEALFVQWVLFVLAVGFFIAAITVWDRDRRDNIFGRSDFSYDQRQDLYICPAGKVMTTSGRLHSDGYYRYTASKRDCDICPLKPRCCPKQPERWVPRAPDEAAREYARSLANTETFQNSRRERKKVEMLFAHLKRHLGFERLRLRGAFRAQGTSSSSPQPSRT